MGGRGASGKGRSSRPLNWGDQHPLEHRPQDHRPQEQRPQEQRPQEQRPQEQRAPLPAVFIFAARSVMRPPSKGFAQCGQLA